MGPLLSNSHPITRITHESGTFRLGNGWICRESEGLVIDSKIIVNHSPHLPCFVKPPTSTFSPFGRNRTSFDNNEKKHWLTVHKGELVGRFMLQDNLKPAWNDAKSTPEKIRSAVDAMIDKINEESERSK